MSSVETPSSTDNPTTISEAVDLLVKTASDGFSKREKRSDVDDVIQAIRSNPMLAGSLLGAGGGAALGGLSSLARDEEDRAPWQSALTGGAAGGLLGLGAGAGYKYMPEIRRYLSSAGEATQPQPHPFADMPEQTRERVDQAMREWFRGGMAGDPPIDEDAARQWLRSEEALGYYSGPEEPGAEGYHFGPEALKPPKTEPSNWFDQYIRGPVSEAMGTGSEDNPRIVQPSRERLRELDVPPEALGALERRQDVLDQEIESRLPKGVPTGPLSGVLGTDEVTPETAGAVGAGLGALGPSIGRDIYNRRPLTAEHLRMGLDEAGKSRPLFTGVVNNVLNTPKARQKALGGIFGLGRGGAGGIAKSELRDIARQGRGKIPRLGGLKSMATGGLLGFGLPYLYGMGRRNAFRRNYGNVYD